MNKTLKVLLAVVLFAVVLMLATNVNAKELSELVKDADSGITESTGVSVAGKTIYDVTGDVDATIELKADEKVELKLAANADLKGKITVPAGATLTITGTAMATDKVEGQIDNAGTVALENVTAATINNEGTLTVKNSTVGDVNNYKTVILEEGAAFATDKKVIAMDAASRVTSDVALSTTNVKLDTTKAIEKALAIYTGTKNGETKYFVTAKVTPTITLQDATGKEVTTLVKDDVYTVKAEATYEGYELTLTGVTISGVSLESTEGLTIAGNTITVTDEELDGVPFVITAKFDDVEYKVPVNGAKVENPDDENKDPENPGEENKDPEVPGDENNGEENKDSDNKNDNELDPDTPNTGDHIIPATALLAVVVVANVVYFAKMKRN